jgi:hypothetical protein
MSRKYKLEDHAPVLCEDVLEWGRWFETADRTVAKTKVGAAEVSTVFLGIDHSHRDDGPPVLFETLVFEGPMDGQMERYHTWDEAVAGHAAMVERVKQSA